MYVCMYVCTYVHMYVCMYVCMYLYVLTYVPTPIGICVQIYIFGSIGFVRMYMHAYLQTCLRVHSSNKLGGAVCMQYMSSVRIFG